MEPLMLRAWLPGGRKLAWRMRGYPPPAGSH